jgi:ribosome-binding protein aMBF1 (putative translation factor)
MISNERQYQNTQKQIRKFEQQVTELNQTPLPKDENEQLRHQLYLSNFKATLEELQAEAQEYETLKTGNVNHLKIDEFHRLPEILIKARIVRGWTQEQLANKLGLKHQQIQRYESTFYESASFTRIVEVIDALEIKITGDVLIR